MIFSKNIVLLLVASSLSFANTLSGNAHAVDIVSEVRVDTGVRVEVFENAKEMEGRGRVKFVFSGNVGLKLSEDTLVQFVTSMSTGETFNGSFSTVEEGDVLRPFEVHQRRAFAEVHTKLAQTRVQAQLGALGIESGLDNKTGLDRAGWVDGGRVIVDHPEYGEISVTVGAIVGVKSITGEDDPSFITRWEKLETINYVEIEMSKEAVIDSEVLKKISAELGYEHLEGENYIKAAARADFNAISVILEGLVDFHGAKKIVFGYGFNLNDVVAGLNAGVFYEYYEPTLHGELSSGIYNAEGVSWLAELGLKRKLKGGAMIKASVKGRFAPIAQDFMVRADLTLYFRAKRK
ncbi:MAG: hypothetical protein HOE90_05425 [Bacteriovoracaceae bacterium]|jgi:hypothetical protein|nr:hypothetical protein [Bacteriovoracaceae bacterium]